MKVVALLFGIAAGHDVEQLDPNYVVAAFVKPATPDSVTAVEFFYQVNGKSYQGYLAKPKEGEPVGALLIAHGWMGLQDYEKARAEQFAAMGYVAFAADAYGQNERCFTNTTCAGERMTEALADAPGLRSIISGATTKLVGAYGGKTDKLVAMGYCFGGAVVMDLARFPDVDASAGVTFKAVSAIHTTFTVIGDKRADLGTMKTRVQVHHAQLDFGGDAALNKLEDELNSSTTGLSTRWEVLRYGKMSHGWTQPGSDDHASSASAAVQVHASTFAFFQDALGNTDDPSKNAFPLFNNYTCPASPSPAPSPPPSPAPKSPSPPPSGGDEGSDEHKLAWYNSPVWFFLVLGLLALLIAAVALPARGQAAVEEVGLAEIA